MSSGGPNGSGPRIALYSHDTMGLGHVRRNLLIAQALAVPPVNASILLVTGICKAGAFAIPRGIDCLALPAYFKETTGRYRARSLAMGPSELAHLRAEVIKAGLGLFEPDLLIVDNVPRGALDEMMPALTHLAERGRTRCVLGLRDVLDQPSAVREEWHRRKNFETIRDFYDAVWIYGDPAVYDLASEYGFAAEIRAKSCYTGYLDPQLSSGGTSRPARHGADLLCVVGGGQDGFSVARSFAEAAFPDRAQGLIVTGPFMSRAERDTLAAIAASRRELTVKEFVFDPTSLLRRARSIVAMGGYNTVSEILSLEKNVLLVPRGKPRMEQLIRARRLKALGLVDYIPDDELNAGAISRWLHQPGHPTKAREAIDFNGLERVVEQVSALIGTFPHGDLAAPEARLRLAAR